MSQENVELHRRFVDAFNARDLETLVALADPSIEYHSVFGELGAIYHGRDEVRRFFAELGDTWREIRLEPEAFFDLGEHTVVFQVARGLGELSGAEVAMPMAGVGRWRDGLCVYAKVYAHREDALTDLGVSEDALEPLAP